MSATTDSAREMYASDRASQSLGISIELAEPGKAVATMTVRADHCNGLGVCHGGLIFTLAGHEQFFLYPTFDHQRNDLVRESHHAELRRALEEGVWPDEEPPPRNPLLLLLLLELLDR